MSTEKSVNVIQLSQIKKDGDSQRNGITGQIDREID